MLSEGQETIAVVVICFVVAALVALAFSAVFPYPPELWSYQNLLWLVGFSAAFNLVWAGAMRLYRRHLQPRIVKRFQC